MIEQLESRRMLAANSYIEQDQASDGAVAAGHTDAHLVNPWGLVAYLHGFEVANADSGFATSYDASGNSTGPAVAIPGSPTGIVLNRDTTKFLVNPGGGASASQFIFATEEGTIEAWATTGGNQTIVTPVDHSANGASYKGLALAKVGKNPFLYVANFGQRRIDVFNAAFVSKTLAGTFTDPHLNSGYSPFNVQLIGDKLFVTYARKFKGDADETAGAGLGVVDIFNTDGTFVKRFATGKTLNAPWGLAQAPSNFAAFSNDILVGNFGDGKISAFDPTTGKFQGQLKDSNGDVISIDGLWGIAFGNGKANTLKNGLYFTAGVDDEAHGLYGRLIVNPSAGPYVVPMAIKAHTDDLIDCVMNASDGTA